jgi:hypothetical protein
MARHRSRFKPAIASSGVLFYLMHWIFDDVTFRIAYMANSMVYAIVCRASIGGVLPVIGGSPALFVG